MTHSLSADPLTLYQRPGMRHQATAAPHHAAAQLLDTAATSSGGPAAFVCTVSWAQASAMLVAANSLGVIQVLELE